MSFQEIEIDSPEEIYGAVRHTAENAEDSLYRTALNHSHTSTVRGYGEQKIGLNGELGEDIEVRREDGGNTWYHSPESRCIMLGVPLENGKNAEELMKSWGEGLSRKLDEYSEGTDLGDIEPVYLERDGHSMEEAWDVYDRNSGRQLFGLSMKIFEDSTVVRTCFYDGEDHGELFERMVQKDGQDYEEFADRYIALEGFYGWLLEDRAEEITPQLERGDVAGDNRVRRPPSPCVVKVEDIE